MLRANLQSETASAVLKPVIDKWFAQLQRDIERETDPLCRDHGLPAMVLSLDDSQHVSRHLQDLAVAAPKVNTMESDTALMGANVPVLARQIMTDGRIRRAANKQRPELIQAVDEAWQQAAADRFTEDLTLTLRTALSERADERAMLFLI